MNLDDLIATLGTQTLLCDGCPERVYIPASHHYKELVHLEDGSHAITTVGADDPMPPVDPENLPPAVREALERRQQEAAAFLRQEARRRFGHTGAAFGLPARNTREVLKPGDTVTIRKADR